MIKRSVKCVVALAPLPIQRNKQNSCISYQYVDIQQFQAVQLEKFPHQRPMERVPKLLQLRYTATLIDPLCTIIEITTVLFL